MVYCIRRGSLGRQWPSLGPRKMFPGRLGLMVFLNGVGGVNCSRAMTRWDPDSKLASRRRL